MVVQAGSRNAGEGSLRKTSGRQPEGKGKSRDALHQITEYSLREFLESEPDLYTVADIKVRYQ